MFCVTPPLPVPSPECKRRRVKKQIILENLKKSVLSLTLRNFRQKLAISSLPLSYSASSFLQVRKKMDLKSCKILARLIYNLARILQVGFKSCKNLARWIQILQESCKMLARSMHSLARLLARFLQDYKFFDH